MAHQGTLTYYVYAGAGSTTEAYVASREIAAFIDGVLTGVGVCRGFSGGFPLASRMFGPREPALTIVDRLLAAGSSVWSIT
jgi:hypothetical protein